MASQRAHGVPGRGKLRPTALRELLRRVVIASQPDAVILFGSAARGEMNPRSDVDFLVVKAGRYERRPIREKLQQQFRGAEDLVHVILVTPEEVQLYRNSRRALIYWALKDGKVVYRR